MLIAGSLLFLVCSTSAYNSTRSTISYQTAAGVPVDGVLIANSSSSVSNLSSSHETTNKDVEERANGGLFGKMFDTITDLVKGPVPAEYTFYVTSLNKYEDLDAVLTSPEMESLYNFCKEYNDKHKNKLSSVAPVLKRFEDKAINNKLHDLAMNADGKQPMMKHLALQHRDNLLMKKKQSPMKFFELLEFGDDLTEAIPYHNWNLLLTILTTHFGGEGNLVQQIYEVKLRLGDNAIDFVKPLKMSLFYQWNKLSLDSVWDRLQVGPKAYDALTSGGVTEALADAMILPHSEEFASTMCHERLNYWKANLFSLQKVFDLLKFSNVDGANSALFKLETFSDFIWSNFVDSIQMRARLRRFAYQASVALKKDDRLAYKLSAADLQKVLFEVWTHDRIPPEKLFSKLNAPIDTDGNINLGVNEANVDRDVLNIPFDTPRRS
ncbi:hypothetical protein Plhal703r1_c31g0121791 [Plasmopara halstedii]